MDRRLLTVLGMSVVLALVVAAIFYQVSAHARPNTPVVATRDVVVATEALPLGVAIKPNNVEDHQDTWRDVSEDGLRQSGRRARPLRGQPDHGGRSASRRAPRAAGQRDGTCAGDSDRHARPSRSAPQRDHRRRRIHPPRHARRHPGDGPPAVGKATSTTSQRPCCRTSPCLAPTQQLQPDKGHRRSTPPW